MCAGGPLVFLQAAENPWTYPRVKNPGKGGGKIAFDSYQ